MVLRGLAFHSAGIFSVSTLVEARIDERQAAQGSSFGRAQSGVFCIVERVRMYRYRYICTAWVVRAVCSDLDSDRIAAISTFAGHTAPRGTVFGTFARHQDHQGSTPLQIKGLREGKEITYNESR